MMEFPPYKPDGVWNAVLDATQIVEAGAGWELIAVALARLADRFELLPGRREQDLARLFKAISRVSFDGFDDEEDDEFDREFAEDKPLGRE
jgi:hypothetical protein